MNKKSRNMRKLAVATTGLVLVLFYQNCAQHINVPTDSGTFGSTDTGDNGPSGDGSNDPNSPQPPIAGQPPVTNPPPTTQPPVQQPPPTTNPPPPVGSNPPTAGYLPDPTGTGKVLEVCGSGCAYATPSAAMAAAASGDVILIKPGQYVDCTWVNKPNIIIRGVLTSNGDRPKVHTKVCGRKGIFVVTTNDVLIENLELYGARDTAMVDKNWAGIRIDSGASVRNLKVRNCFIHDNDNGILGNEGVTGSNVVVVENSIFTRNGLEGYAHGLYIGSGVSLFVLRNSFVYSNTHDGHLVKSRAQESIIECSTIAGLNGISSSALDFPQGGRVTVRKNVLEHGPKTVNNNNFFIQFAEENQKNAPHKIVVTDNYFVNDYTRVGTMKIMGSPDTSGWSGNTYVGMGSAMTLTGYVGANSFTNYPSRAAAALPSYTGSLNDLPARPHCP